MKHRYVTALVVMAAITALACEGTKVPSDRDPESRQVDPATARKVTIKAKADGPYEVVVDAYDAAGGHEGWHELVASGHYRQTLDYSSGLKIRIVIEVKAGKRGDNAWCAIVDGLLNNTEDGPDDERRNARCYLTTNR